MHWTRFRPPKLTLILPIQTWNLYRVSYLILIRELTWPWFTWQIRMFVWPPLQRLKKLNYSFDNKDGYKLMAESKNLKKNQKNIKIWQTLYSKLIGDSKLIEVIESNESDKFSLVSLSSSKAADDRAILLLLTDSLSKILEWSENELKLIFLWKMDFSNYFTWTRSQNILHL